MKFPYLSTIPTALEAAATILSAVRVITTSIKSLVAIPHSNNGSEPNHKDSRLGMHKWIFIAGAAVGLITVAYLENIAINLKPKQNTVKEKPAQERFEPVYVNS